MSTAVPQASVQSVMTDETTSVWLRTALQGALQRDPVDSLNDALLLAGLLEERLRLFFELEGIGQASREGD